MDISELGFLAAGALAVVVGLTAPVRPVTRGMRPHSPLGLVAGLVSTGVCIGLIAAAPGMVRDTPVAVVLGLSLIHVGASFFRAFGRPRADVSRAPGTARSLPE